VAASSAKVPWYKTMRGQLTAIIIGLALIGLVMWRMSVNSSEASKLEKRQDALVEYTTEVNTYVTKVEQTIREMLGAAFNTANPEALAALDGSAPRWAETMEGQAALVQALVPPEDLVPANLTLQQAFMGYASSAKLYEMVAKEEENKKIQELIDRAMEVREQAGVLLGTAVGLLDQARAEAEMAPSGIEIPASMTPILPTPSPVESAADNDRDKKKSDG
jgi:hypothetical protein